MDYREVLKAHTVLDRKYRIDRVIGAGGFGITYQAFDIGLAAPVAIKEYYPAQFGMRDSTLSVRARTDGDRPLFDRLRASFLREARTLAQFDHPAIVRVLSVFETHGTAYMVMRFESGESLKVWLKELGRAPLQSELDRLLGPLLDAIELMHMAEFLHRDIAPDNIIVRADGTPVLLDFGASRRVISDMSGTLTGVVKQGYSPQEQYSSDIRSQGPWTDIYSLGATLYLAVTGKIPTEATARMLEDGMMPAAESARGNYRPEFLSAIDHSMRLRPRDRPQSVDEWRQMLFSGAGAGWYPEGAAVGLFDSATGPGGIRVPASSPRGRSFPRGAAPADASAPSYPNRSSPRSGPGAVSSPRSSPSTDRRYSEGEERELSAPQVPLTSPSLATRATDLALSTRGAVVLGIGAMLLGGTMLLAFEPPSRRSSTSTRADLNVSEISRIPNGNRAEVELARLEVDRQAAIRLQSEAETRRQEAARQAELQRQQDEARKAGEAEAARQAEIQRQQDEARKAAEAEARRQEAVRQAGIQRQQDEARKAADAEARRQEAVRQAELQRQQDEARKVAEAEVRRQEAVRQAELQRQQDEARKAAEAEVRRQEAVRQAELQRQQDEARKAAEAEARRQEAARQAELQRQQDEARKAADAEVRRQEAARQAELQRQQDEARKAAEAEATRQRLASAAGTALGDAQRNKEPATGEGAARGPVAVPAHSVVFADPVREPGHFAQTLVAANGAVVAGGAGGRIRTWPPGKTDLVAFPAKSTAPVTALSASPDGHRAASGSSDGSIYVWDVRKPALLHTIRGEGAPVVAVRYRSDTRVVAVDANGHWMIAQPETGEVLMSGTKDGGVGITAAQFADEGKIAFVGVAGGADGNVIEGWVPADGGVTRVAARLVGHTQRVNALAASEDGALVASASDDGTVRLWKVDGGREITRLEPSSGAVVRSLAFSATGTLVAGAGADGTIDIWQASDGKRVASYRGTEDGLYAAVFGTDGASVVAAGADGAIRQWLLPAAFVVRPSDKEKVVKPVAVVVPKPRIERPDRDEKPELKRHKPKREVQPERRRVRERRETPAPRRGPSGGGGSVGFGGGGITVRVPSF